MKLLLIAVTAAMMVFNLTAADLTGTWKGSMETQNGNTSVAVTIQPGTGLVGKVRVADYDGVIQNGKLTGDKIFFETQIEPGKLTFEGTVANDQMQLMVTGTHGDQYKLVCQREK